MIHLLKKLAFVSIASAAAACAFAQTPPAQSDTNAQSTTTAESDKTAPQAASSPHQRQTTETAAAEANTNSESEPSSSSSPHQRGATKTANAKGAQHEEMLNNCISEHQKAHANATKDQAKRACMDQMKKAETPAG